MNVIGLRVLDRLGLRVALALAVILLPLAVVSIMRSQAVISQTEARTEAALFGETVRLAGTELSLIEKARGAARSVAAIAPAVVGDVETCSNLMRRIAEINGLSFVGFIAVDGSVPCSSADVALNLADDPDFAAAVENPQELVRRNPNAETSGRSMIVLRTPVFDPLEKLVGYAAATIPKDQIPNQREGMVEGSKFVSVNADGEILASSLPIDSAAGALPAAGLPANLLTEGGTFRAVSVEGVPKIYVVAPVLSGQIVMVGLLSEADADRSLFYMQRATYFPLLMWLASLVVGFFVVEFLVSRHIKTIVGAIRRFGEARQFRMPDTLRAAPNELRDIADAFEAMTTRVLIDAETLREGLQQKNTLLREVHHRTKNNLQMISSIMSMQIRRTGSQEIRAVIRELQDRVMALATVHEGLYQTTGAARVQMDTLLSDIIKQVQALTPQARSTQIALSCPLVFLKHDQAVPFSLLVTEALANAIKYATPSKTGRPHVCIDLSVEGDSHAALVIENTFDPNTVPLQDKGAGGFGAQLMAAFAEQLDATIDVSKADDVYRFTLGLAVNAPELEGGDFKLG